MRIKIVKAEGIKLIRMRSMNWWTMAEYPNSVYVRVKKGFNFQDALKHIPATIIRHEVTHLKQMQRDGLAKFRARYWMQAATKGYKNIDYEIEARAAENDETIKYEIINKGDFLA